MKTLRLFTLMIGIALTSLSLFSCLDDDGYSLGDLYAPEIATVVPEGNTYYLRLDDGTTFWPAATNYPGYKPKKDQRAVIYYTILGDSIPGYSHPIKVNRIDDILTKPLVDDLGSKNDSIYGKDPVQINGLLMGDGFLHISLTANFGGQEAHLVNLLHIKSSSVSPYVLEFRHNAFNDPAIAAVQKLICFNLSTLPDTKGKFVDLIIKVHTFNGEKEYKVKYNSDKSLMPENTQSSSKTKGLNLDNPGDMK